MESRTSTVPHETLLLYSGPVIVGEDGNGVTADRFATTTDDDQVRYFLGVIPAGDGPPSEVTITLNDDVVLVTQVEFDRDRVEVALNPTDTDLNAIVIAARGVPNSAARVAVLAERPAEVSLEVCRSCHGPRRTISSARSWPSTTPAPRRSASGSRSSTKTAALQAAPLRNASAGTLRGTST